jgi:hypothetical protein
MSCLLTVNESHARMLYFVFANYVSVKNLYRTRFAVIVTQSFRINKVRVLVQFLH